MPEVTDKLNHAKVSQDPGAAMEAIAEAHPDLRKVAGKITPEGTDLVHQNVKALQEGILRGQFASRSEFYAYARLTFIRNHLRRLKREARFTAWEGLDPGLQARLETEVSFAALPVECQVPLLEALDRLSQEAKTEIEKRRLNSFHLHYLKEQTIEATAEILGTTTHTVKNDIAQVKQALKAALLRLSRATL